MNLTTGRHRVPNLSRGMWIERALDTGEIRTVSPFLLVACDWGLEEEWVVDRCFLDFTGEVRLGEDKDIYVVD